MKKAEIEDIEISLLLKAISERYCYDWLQLNELPH
jgi:hypothetical protein